LFLLGFDALHKIDSSVKTNKVNVRADTSAARIDLDRVEVTQWSDLHAGHLDVTSFTLDLPQCDTDARAVRLYLLWKVPG